MYIADLYSLLKSHIKAFFLFMTNEVMERENSSSLDEIICPVISVYLISYVDNVYGRRSHVHFSLLCFQCLGGRELAL